MPLPLASIAVQTHDQQTPPLIRPPAPPTPAPSTHCPQGWCWCLVLPLKRCPQGKRLLLPHHPRTAPEGQCWCPLVPLKHCRQASASLCITHAPPPRLMLVSSSSIPALPPGKCLLLLHRPRTATLSQCWCLPFLFQHCRQASASYSYSCTVHALPLRLVLVPCPSSQALPPGKCLLLLHRPRTATLSQCRYPLLFCKHCRQASASYSCTVHALPL